MVCFCPVGFLGRVKHFRVLTVEIHMDKATLLCFSFWEAQFQGFEVLENPPKLGTVLKTPWKLRLWWSNICICLEHTVIFSALDMCTLWSILIVQTSVYDLEEEEEEEKMDFVVFEACLCSFVYSVRYTSMCHFSVWICCWFLALYCSESVQWHQAFVG